MLLCTKCYDNAAVLAKLPPAVTLVPIQNGFDPQLDGVRAPVRGDRVVRARSATRNRPYTEITRPGDLHVGCRAVPARVGPGTVPAFGRT